MIVRIRGKHNLLPTPPFSETIGSSPYGMFHHPTAGVAVRFNDLPCDRGQRVTGQVRKQRVVGLDKRDLDCVAVGCSQTCQVGVVIVIAQVGMMFEMIYAEAHRPRDEIR